MQSAVINKVKILINKTKTLFGRSFPLVPSALCLLFRGEVRVELCLEFQFKLKRKE
jgi:hypothetical protein